ncbi:MAG: bestrophin family ion channel [Synechococcaceae cyanobacterium]|nr:bestrophin family ion channel [Synechococcaceae cyanobacterium]
MLRVQGRAGGLKVLALLGWTMRGELLLVVLVCLLSLPLSPQLGRRLTPDLVVPLLGVASSVLLAFRLNLSHGRWWEARRLWGALRGHSRAWHLSLIALRPVLSPGDPQRLRHDLRQLQERQVLLVWTLAAELRPGLEPVQPQALETLRRRVETPAAAWRQAPMAGLEPEEQEGAAGSALRWPCPNAGSRALLRAQAEALHGLAAEHGLEPMALSTLTQVLTAMEQPLGALERLATTPFPAGYMLLARLMVWAFGYALFLSLETHTRTLPHAGVLGALLMLGFVAAERLSCWHDEPLRNRLTGLPLGHYCAGLSADLLGPSHPLAQPPQGPQEMVWT